MIKIDHVATSHHNYYKKGGKSPCFENITENYIGSSDIQSA